MKNIIIGAGPAGRLAALELGKLEEEVLLIEKKYIAGTCLNEGCMVICALTDIARFLNNKKHYESLGLIKGNIEISYEEITKKIKKTQEILRKINQEENESFGNEIIYGNAKINESSVSVNGETYDFENLLIATGAKPFIPKISGTEHCLISSDILNIKEIPEKLNIIGGGIIAAEIGNIFSSFGSKVNIITRNSFLTELDSEIREYVIKAMYKDVNIYENTDVLKIHKNKVETNQGEFGGKTFLATGRTPNSEIANNRLELNEDKSIKVNEIMQTSISNIYAAGDVTGGLNLTPIARKEGIIAARAMGGYPNKIIYKNIPQSLSLDMDVSFTQKEEHDDNLVDITFPGVAGSGGFWKVLNQETGLTKISLNKNTGKLDSINAISPSSVSDVAYLSFLMRTNQNIEDFDDFIEIHPSTDTFYKLLKNI